MSNTIGNKLDDKDLVDKVLNGDPNAFGAIIKNTERLVAQVVFKMISNAEDRKDIAQDVYLKAFNNLPRFRVQAKLSTWIAQIAYNTCFTYLEKKRLVLTGDRPDENEWDDAIIDNSVTGTTGNPIESMIFEKERAAAISIAIEKLSPLYKTLITLYHNEELSYKEIGEITTLPEGTIKSYLFRARKELKESLLQQYKKGEL